MRQIAFFDFDGTITYKDTLLEIAKFHKGKAAWLVGMLLLSPLLIGMKLKLVNNTRMKERYLSFFFGGISVEDFQILCEAFVQQKIPALLRPGALAEIKKHQDAGTPVVLVSASPENWLKSWCAANNITCIATRLAVKDGLITGTIDGNNCFGPEKVRRIRELYDLSDFQQIFCYGDSSGDRELLEIATSPHYKPFR